MGLRGDDEPGLHSSCVVSLLHSGCSSAERRASSQADALSSTSASLAASLRLNADGGHEALEEMTGCCSYLHGAVSGTSFPFA